MAIVKLGARAAFIKFAHKVRKTRATKTRLPWRTRKKRTRRNGLTPAEKAARRKIKEDKRKSKEASLADAIAEIHGLAHKLAETHGDHNQRYYYRLLIQQAGKLQSKRKENLWNVFLHKETQRRIKGE